MSKWFESKNLANYAKTALLQAQKQIDKVLDIKEEEILARQTALKQTEEQPNQQQQNESENFFSTFLNQINTNSNSNTRSNSPSLHQEEQSNRKVTRSKTSSTASITVIKDEINYDQFVNKDNLTTHQEQEIDSIFNLKSPSLNSFTAEDDNKPSNTRLARTPSSSSVKTTKQQNSIELEKIEKKNWVQNYVDSNGGNDSIIIENTTFTAPLDDDTNKTVINESVEQFQDNKDEMLASINDSELNQKTTESYHSGSTTNNNETLTNLSTDLETTKEEFKIIQFSESVQSIEATSPTSSIEDDKKIPNNTTKSMMDMEYVKIDGCSSLSGNSQSGHASSAEEQETCASSDIEVISLPSNNGDQLIALKHFKSLKNNKIKPNENIEESKQFKPNANVMQIYVKSPPAPVVTPQETDHVALLEARESHILKLNKQTVKLQEENDNLSNELEKLKFESVERFKTMQQAHTDLNSRCEHFSAENERFKKINTDLNREFIEMQKLIKEKDEQVEQLKQEGLKLSKQELNQSNIIKKLRTKEKENEESLNILRNDFQKTQKELDEMKKMLDLKEEAEKANLESFKKLEKGAVYLEKELISTKTALEDSQEKVTSLENTLQNTFKELAELHRMNAAKDNRINEATSSIETQFKEEIQTAVDKERLLSNKKQESLKWELQSVRSDISRLEHQHSLREDMLRKEIADLQQQLRDTEMRNNELSQNVSTATRPLLRQIENLQVSNSSQIELLENAERNLIDRLKESQATCCELTEKNRHNKEQLFEMTQQIKTYEAQIQTLKGEKFKLNAEYQQAKSNLDSYESEKYEKDAQTKVLVNSLNQQIEKLVKEKKSLEAQLDMEKLRVENDSKKVQSLMTELAKERETQQQQQKQLMNTSTSSIDSSSTTPSTPNNSFMRRVSSNQFDLSSNGRNELIQSIQTTGAYSMLENLQSKLKQKDGEIYHLQNQIQNLEKIRESMAKELVSLSNKLDYMQQQLREYPSLQENFKKLNMEYNALLQMYGEKSEETEELKLDLQDVKEMYKLQIEDLIKRSNLS